MPSYMVCGTRFDVDGKYQLTKPIGQGAYGVVCAARNTATGEKVAIKKVSKVFEHLTDAKRTLRELRLLSHFNHENIINIMDLTRPATGYEKFEDIYIVSELMDTDLHQIIQSPQGLTDDHIQYFVYQILRGVKYIHSANVLHRDLKPSNVLLNGNCDLKICDFGLSRVADPESNHGGFLTEYVATRWYRAPEIMLSWKEYTKAIDMWSIGCIMAELFGRRPLFPGKDYISQLDLILEVMGTPAEEDLAYIESDKARAYIANLPRRPKVDFAAKFSSANPQAVQLMEGLLCFDPAKRLTVQQALEHDYLTSLHDPQDEPSCDDPFDFSFDDSPSSSEDLKKFMWQEVLRYHPDQEGAADGTAAAAAAVSTAGAASPINMDMVSDELGGASMDLGGDAASADGKGVNVRTPTQPQPAGSLDDRHLADTDLASELQAMEDGN